VKNLAEFVTVRAMIGGGRRRREELVDNPEAEEGERRRNRQAATGHRVWLQGGRLPAVERCGIDSLGSFEGGDFLGQFHVALAVEAARICWTDRQ